MTDTQHITHTAMRQMPEEEKLQVRTITLERLDDRAGMKTLFNGFYYVKSINVVHSKLPTLPSEGMFDGLPFLTELSFVNCGIKTLSPNFMKGLSGLERLSLSGNYLRALPKRFFKPLHDHKLKELNLCRNRLAKIHPQQFDELYQLKSLDLGFNRLKTLPEGMLGNNPMTLPSFDMESRTEMGWPWIRDNPFDDFSIDQKPIRISDSIYILASHGGEPLLAYKRGGEGDWLYSAKSMIDDMGTIEAWKHFKKIAYDTANSFDVVDKAMNYLWAIDDFASDEVVKAGLRPSDSQMAFNRMMDRAVMEHQKIVRGDGS